MFHVFICYPRTFLAQVTPIHDQLENALRNLYDRDAEVFQDKADLQAGAQWKARVDRALQEARVMVVVVVPTVLDSPQCRREMLHFIRTPGKHIIPLICEQVPRMGDIAASLDMHPAGSEAHDRAICAQALRTWQQHDFREEVYHAPSDPKYVRAIMALARAVRDTLVAEDSARAAPAQAAPQDPGPTPPDPAPRQRRDAPVRQPDPPPAYAREDPSARVASADPSGSPRQKSRRGPLTGLLLGAAAMAAFVGAYFYTTLPNGTETRVERREPVQPEQRNETDTTRPEVVDITPQEPDRITRDMAQEVLFSRLAFLIERQDAEGVSFDAASGALTLKAPIGGVLDLGVAVDGAVKPLLEAGFVPGFADPGRSGAACVNFRRDPTRLESSTLRDGESLRVRLAVYPRGTGLDAQKTCGDPVSPWTPVNAASALMRGGRLFAAPSAEADLIRPLRRGESLQGPFWTSQEASGWVRIRDGAGFAYFERSAINSLD